MYEDLDIICFLEILEIFDMCYKILFIYGKEFVIRVEL